MKFELITKYKPDGDQPSAIKQLTANLKKGVKEQVLLGATGTGKTFTMANVINNVQKPTIILAHNKTLASQLFGEIKELFPNNRVEYFVSYFDYYQPESYLPHTDTYIEKDSAINDEIDRLRHSATASLLERNDVIIVSSVSCIYGLGNPEAYKNLLISLRKDMKYNREELIKNLIKIQYDRNDIEFKRGTFRVRGESIEIILANSDKESVRIDFFEDEIERISLIDIVSGKRIKDLLHIGILPATHYITERDKLNKSLKQIHRDLKKEVSNFQKQNKLVEAQRLEQRTSYDLELMEEIGYCQGIENYTRYFTGLKAGEPTFTLLDYFPDDYLMIIDESHATIPQIGGMYKGDRARKERLVDYGFRLKAALDNRPLQFAEFYNLINQVIYVSATPGKFELEKVNEQCVEQIIRPTGLIDPIIEIRPKENQIDDIMTEINGIVKNGDRMLITTLTKKMSEDLTDYLKELGIKVAYLHSEIKTLERIQILSALRNGVYDVLIGINLLREGLDLPEVTRVLILDADKEGFLRSKTSLLQITGRAARNVDGKVVMYANNFTKAMSDTIFETDRRRNIQIAHNLKHHITPMTILKDKTKMIQISQDSRKLPKTKKEQKAFIEQIREEMESASAKMEFEKAAELRDLLFELEAS